jgi:hypothetical protein
MNALNQNMNPTQKSINYIMDKNTDNKILILHVVKTHPKETGTFTSHKVGDSVAALEAYIRETYKVSELTKDPDDDFPYFTDGGFKYSAKGDYWHYTFTCYPETIISAPSSSLAGREGVKKDWEITALGKESGNILTDADQIGYYLMGYTAGWYIYSVKRLADGEILTIGDNILHRLADNLQFTGNNRGKIIGFSIRGNELSVQFYPEGETSKSGDVWRELINITKAPSKPPIGIEELVEREKAFNAAREMNDKINIALGAPYLKYRSFMEYNNLKSAIKKQEGI